MHRIIVLSGPTATGKTALAVNLAQKYNGELISADSRQVYKSMDIGTGKDIDQKSKFAIRTCPERSRRNPQLLDSNSQLSNLKSQFDIGYYLLDSTPLWLLDVVSPNQPFSVADYQKLAQTAILDIWKRGKLPILVGGTGLYIKSIIDGIETVGIPQNLKLREKLSKLSLSDLQKTLQSQNLSKWNSMNSSDQQNPRRLVRAIEIIQFGKGQFLAIREADETPRAALIKNNILHLSLTAPNVVLYQRIDDRVEKRVKQGIIDEIKSLLKKGYLWDLPSMSACGYRVWKDYFEKKATLKEIVQKWKFQEHDYARRQITWFKKDPRIKCFDITEKGFSQNIFQIVEPFLNKKPTH